MEKLPARIELALEDYFFTIVNSKSSVMTTRPRKLYVYTFIVSNHKSISRTFLKYYIL